jgi:hypothetical protein
MTSGTKLDQAFRLDPVHERILQVALLRDGEAGARWRALRRDIDLDDLWDGKALDVLPLVYRALIDEGADDPDLPRLRGVHRRTWFANQLRFRALAEALRLLSAAEVDTLVLKGSAWALTAYSDIGLRPMHDCDIVVRPGAVERALEALSAGGWTARGQLPANHAVRHQEIDVVDPDAWVIDLHWHVARWLVPWGEEWNGDEPYWARSVPLDVSGVATRALEPTDALLHAVVHGARGGWREAPQWVPDAVFIMERADSIEWDRLVDTAVSRNLALPVRTGLQYLRTRFEVAVPSTVVAQLDVPSSARSRRRFARAGRGMNPTRTETRVLGPLAPTYRFWITESAPLDRRTAVRTFPGWLADHWGAGSPWRLPQATVQRVVGRLNGSRAAADVSTPLVP